MRIQAGRLRRSLERYYLLSGPADPVRIELPRGTYVPGPAVGDAGRGADERAGARRASPRPRDGWPTVVVQPVRAGGADPELEDARPRFLDHLSVELGRYRDVRVVLRREPIAPGTSPCGTTRGSLSRVASRGTRRACA